MQDRYAGDIGDYSKLLLLWELHYAGLKTGVQWYLADEEDHNDDGRFTAYLSQNRFVDAAPELAAALSRVVQGERSVSSLLRHAACPPGPHFQERLSIELLGSGGRHRREQRHAWVQRGLDATSDAQLVCFDPDNGLNPASATRGQRRANKYLWVDELMPFVSRSQSVMVYQHSRRDLGDRVAQAAVLRRALEPLGPCRILRWSPYSARFYGLVVQESMREAVAQAVTALLNGPAGSWFEEHQ